jgi:CubicO group peptidase (beta-lactamase class C family)
MASVAAMLLMEDGVVQPTDPVSKWLPAFKDMKVYSGAETVAATRVMTVQDLLRHTSGIGYGEINPTQTYRDALKEAGVYKPGVIDFDIRDLTPTQFTERLAKVPLVHQPGTAWEYSLSTDVLGRVVEAASGKRLGAFLEERVYGPLRMTDTAFFVPDSKKGRLAASFDKDPVNGTPFRLIDVSREPGNDSGGAGAVSTAPDYLRFAQMLLNGGTLDGRRIMSRATIKYMASDHLGTKIPIAATPGGNVLAPSNYTFGLGVAVRPGDGIAGTPGSAGDFYWGGYAGTYFWIDPREQLTAVMMMQSPGVQRPFHRNLLRQLVYQAISD